MGESEGIEGGADVNGMIEGVNSSTSLALFGLTEGSES